VLIGAGTEVANVLGTALGGPLLGGATVRSCAVDEVCGLEVRTEAQAVLNPTKPTKTLNRNISTGFLLYIGPLSDRVLGVERPRGRLCTVADSLPFAAGASSEPVVLVVVLSRQERTGPWRWMVAAGGGMDREPDPEACRGPVATS
jgi:hypothetical protein